jgi:hypothetical protein
VTCSVFLSSFMTPLLCVAGNHGEKDYGARHSPEERRTRGMGMSCERSLVCFGPLPEGEA